MDRARLVMRGLSTKKAKAKAAGAYIRAQGEYFIAQRKVRALEARGKQAEKREQAMADALADASEKTEEARVLGEERSRLRKFAMTLVPDIPAAKRAQAARSMNLAINGKKPASEAEIRQIAGMFGHVPPKASDTPLTPEQEEAAAKRKGVLRGITNRAAEGPPEPPKTQAQLEEEARQKGDLAGITEDAKKDRLTKEGRGVPPKPPKPPKPSKPYSEVTPDKAGKELMKGAADDKGFHELPMSIEQLIAAGISKNVTESAEEPRRRNSVREGLRRAEMEGVSPRDAVSRTFAAFPADLRTPETAVALLGVLPEEVRREAAAALWEGLPKHLQDAGEKAMKKVLGM